MKVRVLGCSGAIAKDCRTTSFLIDGDVLVDAGTGVGELTLDEMRRVDHVFLTHAHLDHIASLPLMIDTTQMDVLESALQQLGGRAIINSVNLEDGEEKADRICQLARQYGAALVALTIDEDGMAKTAARKVAVAKRLYDIACGRWGLPPSALLFDPLTFTIGSGDEAKLNQCERNSNH